MNILFVSDIPFNPIAGGLERVTDGLTKELVKRGYNAYYLCGKLPESRQYLLDYEFPATVFLLPNYGLFEDDENITFYQKLQDELRIDVVVNQRGLSGWFNDLLPVTHTKLISVIHSKPDAGVIKFLNSLVELTAAPLIRPKKWFKRAFPFIAQAYWKKKIMQDITGKYRKLAQYSDAIVTLSRIDVDKIDSFIGCPRDVNVVSIPNPNTFSEIAIPWDLKEKVILYVGRLARLEKAPLRILEIWKLLWKKHPDWQLKIVGDGDEKQRMLDYVTKKRLCNVFFEGPQTNVAQYYKQASCICLTSNFEGWGMALTEGAQYGCLPFTFDNYGAAFDIIDDDINGCLIPAYDIKKYASRLSELMLDNDRRLKMAKAASEKVKQFSVENVTDKWEELFKSL